MSSLNKVMLIGRLGRDPETRTTQSGQTVCNLSLATDESYVKDGAKIKKVEWHRIVVWGKTAENCGKYLAKGRMVYVEGSLETRKWQDKSGQERYTTEIKAHSVQFLDGGESVGQGGERPADARPEPEGAPRGRMPDDGLGPAFPSESGAWTMCRTN